MGDESIRISFADVAAIRTGGERVALELLGPSDHIHGNLRIQVQGRPLPHLGYWGTNDACFADWLHELAGVRRAFAGPGLAQYVFDEGEQGQPAFVFEKDGDRAYVTVADSEVSEEGADPDWQRVQFSAAEFIAEHDRFRQAFLAHLRTTAPQAAAEAWIARLASRRAG